MLNSLTFFIKRNSKAGEHDPAVKAYIECCLSDIPMMSDRYIHITLKNRANVKQTYYSQRLRLKRRVEYENEYARVMGEYYENIAPLAWARSLSKGTS